MKEKVVSNTKEKVTFLFIIPLHCENSAMHAFKNDTQVFYCHS